MLIRDLLYLVISDIHFGSNNNKTIDIINHLNLFFKKYDKVLRKLDMLFIAGDIFDRLLSSSSADNINATEWLTSLIYYCKKNNIKLRVLEGTPSHDNRQAILITKVLSRLKIDVDFKYIDTIHIEYLTEYNINILYVPDEIHHDADMVLNDVKVLMEEKGIDKVDIAVMHGAFKYQIPVIDLPYMHNEQEYLQLVRYYISVGHIHIMSIYKRILAQGSIDRMSHNEEGNKGAMLIKITKDGESSYKFLINDNATIFKSINVETEEVNELIKFLDMELKKYPMDSHIRLMLKKNNPIYKSLLAIYKRYPNYNWSNKGIDSGTEKDIKTENVLKSNPISNIQITNRNLEELLYDEIAIGELEEEMVRIIHEEVSSII